MPACLPACLPSPAFPSPPPSCAASPTWACRRSCPTHPSWHSGATRSRRWSSLTATRTTSAPCPGWSPRWTPPRPSMPAASPCSSSSAACRCGHWRGVWEGVCGGDCACLCGGIVRWRPSRLGAGRQARQKGSGTFPASATCVRCPFSPCRYAALAPLPRLPARRSSTCGMRAGATPSRCGRTSSWAPLTAPPCASPTPSPTAAAWCCAATTAPSFTPGTGRSMRTPWMGRCLTGTCLTSWVSAGGCWGAGMGGEGWLGRILVCQGALLSAACPSLPAHAHAPTCWCPWRRPTRCLQARRVCPCSCQTPPTFCPRGAPPARPWWRPP